MLTGKLVSDFWSFSFRNYFEPFGKSQSRCVDVGECHFNLSAGGDDLRSAAGRH